MIRRDIDPAGAGGLDPGQDFRHLAPIGLVSRLEMPDLGRDGRLLGDREDFLERIEDLIPLRALVG